MDYAKEILKLKKEKNALILVHNYQSEDIQLIADELGDSLDLSRKAKASDKNLIVFCGVSFMAESAKILSPEKTILHPVKEARCPMADMISAEKVRALREKFPDAAFVAYINTNAETKTEVDVICTSANAADIVRNLPQKQIVFLPDKNLGRFVAKQVPEKEIILFDGYCAVHEFLYVNELAETKKQHPDALILTHPEANENISDLSDHLLGTGGMINFVKNSDHKEFIIGTEEGLIDRLRREFPEKKFFGLQPRIICENMKKIKLEDVYLSLKNLQYEVELEPNILRKAKVPLDRMLELSK